MGVNPKSWKIGFKWTKGDASNPAGAIGVDNTSKALHIADIDDIATDWNVAADSHPSVYLHSATTPATDYIKMYHDATDAFINGAAATNLYLQLSGTTEVGMSATILDLASADLQMQTGGQILDNNGNELVEFVIGNASAVNGILIRNAATTVAPWIVNEGGEDIGLVLGNNDGTNYEEILILAQTATAVNEVTITNAATGNAPQIAASGETNVGLDVSSKGTGSVTLWTGAKAREALILVNTASAVNEFTMTQAATGSPPVLSVTGGDTNISMRLTAKGTGVIQTTQPLVEEMSQTALTATATVTIAQLLTKVIDGTPTEAATYTLPTAADLVGGIANAQVGDSFLFFVNNKAGGAYTITIGAGSGGTADGTLTVAQNVIREFLVIVTNVTGSSEAYFVYGMGA